MENEDEKAKNQVKPWHDCPNNKICVNSITDVVVLGLFSKIEANIRDIALPPNEWKIYYRIEVILLRYPRDQPQHVEEEEAERIAILRRRHKYSVGDLAFIFNRSKSTIHEVLKARGMNYVEA